MIAIKKGSTFLCFTHSCLPLSKINSEQWKTFTRRRWPLFRPIAAVRDWFATYSALVESCFCLTCIYQMAEEVIPAFPTNFQVLPLREKRLGHDLQGMLTDPPEGDSQ